MLVIGLTGGTGSGKGCVGECFLSYGIKTIDTDIVSRSVCEPGKPCFLELVSYFGTQIIDPDGKLNRKTLAKVAFSDPEGYKMLNTITHKHILSEVRVWLSQRKKCGDVAAIVDAPLLYESGFDKECDIIIAVVAPLDIRADRIMKRDNISPDEIKARIDKQGNDDFYTRNADHVIVNDGLLTKIQEQVDKIYFDIFGKGC